MCEVENWGSSSKPLQKHFKNNFSLLYRHVQDGELFIPAHLGSQIQPAGCSGAASDRLSPEDMGKPGPGTEPCREASPALLNGQSAPQSNTCVVLGDISSNNPIHSCCPFVNCIVSAKPCHLKIIISCIILCARTITEQHLENFLTSDS